MKQIFIFLTLLFLGSGHALAYYNFEKFEDEISTPVTTDAKYALWIGGGLTLSLWAFKDQVVVPFQEKQVRNKTLGDSSRWGDWMGQLVPNILYIGAFAYRGAYMNDPAGHRRAVGMFKATLYSTSVTTFLKYTVRESRPIDKDWRNSFPSGHTTSAFAFGGYVMAEHEYWLGIPALILSTFIGYSRINDNMHWLHDVTAGATIGWVYGWGISKLQQKTEKEKEKSTFIAPIYDSRTVGISLYKEF